MDFSCCLLTPGILFLCGSTTYVCFPTNWTGTCNLVYLAPDISIAPNNQTLPIPLTHNWPRQAIQFDPLLISLGIAGIGTGTAGLTTSLNYYQSLPKDLTDSLEEIANSLITIQNQLDSLAAVVLQKRRGLDLLTAEKGSLCLFLEEACCFYTNKSSIVKGAARNLTKRGSRIHQHLSNLWENWLSNWNWMPWVLPFLGPLRQTYLHSNFQFMFDASFFKISSGLLTSLHQPTIYELLLTRSNYQKLRLHRNPLDPHFSRFLSHPHDTPVPEGTVTEEWPSALLLNQKGWNDQAHIGAHGRNGSLCWLCKQSKITVILETDQIAQKTFCFLTGTYLLKAMRLPDSRPPATCPQDSIA